MKKKNHSVLKEDSQGKDPFLNEHFNETFSVSSTKLFFIKLSSVCYDFTWSTDYSRFSKDWQR